MSKLTDTQRVILAIAGRRENGAVMPLPNSLKTKNSAITAALGGLRRRACRFPLRRPLRLRETRLTPALNVQRSSRSPSNTGCSPADAK